MGGPKTTYTLLYLFYGSTHTHTHTHTITIYSIHLLKPNAHISNPFRFHQQHNPPTNQLLVHHQKPFHLHLCLLHTDTHNRLHHRKEKKKKPPLNFHHSFPTQYKIMIILYSIHATLNVMHVLKKKALYHFLYYINIHCFYNDMQNH